MGSSARCTCWEVFYRWFFPVFQGNPCMASHLNWTKFWFISRQKVIGKLAYISGWYQGSSVGFARPSVPICANYNSIRQHSTEDSRETKWTLVAELAAWLPPSDSSYEFAFYSSAKWSCHPLWCRSLRSSHNRSHRCCLYRHDKLLELMALWVMLMLLVSSAYDHSKIGLLPVTAGRSQTLIEFHVKSNSDRNLPSIVFGWRYRRWCFHYYRIYLVPSIVNHSICEIRWSILGHAIRIHSIHCCRSRWFSFLRLFWNRIHCRFFRCHWIRPSC